MLIIRSEQMEALIKSRELEFENRAAAYLDKAFPEKCGQLSDEAIRDSVKTAMLKRKEYRFESEEAIILYLGLMYLLGFDFDTNAEYDWVKETLTDYDLPPRTRLVLLNEKAATAIMK
jgi:hypothetical protein